MSGIAITGVGAVSPAGWGVPAMMEVLAGGPAPEVEMLERSHAGTTVATPVLRVPAPADRSVIPKHPRLRRASPLARFAAAASAEALGAERIAAVAAGELSLGVVCALMNGCVQYSNRYFSEVIEDPSLASPILFPETVFNAPSSHLSAVFQSSGPNDTVLGDGAEYFAAFELAVEWLERGEVEACLVVATEECDWLSAEGLCYYSRDYRPAEGAAACLLQVGDAPVSLLALPDPVGLAGPEGRTGAMRELRRHLAAPDDGSTLLVDGRAGVPRWDRPEDEVWADWRGPRWSPRMALGEAMGASAAMQLVAGSEAVRLGRAGRAVISAVGGNEQAAGCVVAAAGR